MTDGPAWSPDGSWIAFTHYADTGDAMHDGEDLWLVRPDADHGPIASPTGGHASSRPPGPPTGRRS